MFSNCDLLYSSVVSTSTATATITSSTNNLDFRTLCLAAGWNGTSATTLTITINHGVTVGSAYPWVAAFIIQGSFPGCTLNLINNGTISGAGGWGAGPGQTVSLAKYNADPYTTGSYAKFTSGGIYYIGQNYQGSRGGDAIQTAVAINITNYGNIWSGGGGGGLGGKGSSASGGWQLGGGGGGTVPGLGGISPFATATTGGRGASGSGSTGGYGGVNGPGAVGGGASPGTDHWNQIAGGGGGGSPGYSGGHGGGCNDSSGQPGGAPGYYINKYNGVGGNSLVTWLVNGSRLGLVA